MAKAERGLPSTFSLDIPKDEPVTLGDFLDEPPPTLVPRKEAAPKAPAAFRPEIVPDRPERNQPVRPVRELAQRPRPERCQLNLTTDSKRMLDEILQYVQTYSPEYDTKPNEVFQGIIGLLHGALDDLDLTTVQRRGAWGSVKAKSFPVALAQSFEQGIVRAAKKRGVA